MVEWMTEFFKYLMEWLNEWLDLINFSMNGPWMSLFTKYLKAQGIVMNDLI